VLRRGGLLVICDELRVELTGEGSPSRT
jgi:hypothetical protein